MTSRRMPLPSTTAFAASAAPSCRRPRHGERAPGLRIALSCLLGGWLTVTNRKDLVIDLPPATAPPKHSVPHPSDVLVVVAWVGSAKTDSSRPALYQGMAFRGPHGRVQVRG